MASITWIGFGALAQWSGTNIFASAKSRAIWRAVITLAIWRPIYYWIISAVGSLLWSYRSDLLNLSTASRGFSAPISGFAGTGELRSAAAAVSI